MGIRIKLLLYVLCVFAVSTGSLVTINVFQSRRILRNRILSDLGALVKARSDQITSVIEQDFERTALVASRTRLRECQLEILSVDSPTQDVQQYRRKMGEILLDAAASVSAITRIDATAKEGRIIASTAEFRIGDKIQLPAGDIRQRGKYHLGKLSRTGDQVRYTVYAPMQNPDKSTSDSIGRIATTFDVRRLTDILTDYTNLGQTGELILGRREPDLVRLLGPLRHHREAAFVKTLPHDCKEAEALARAATPRKKGGVITTTDYRGVKTLCAYRHIPIGNWGLVAKIDQREVMAPIRRLQLQMAFVATAIFIVCVIILVFFTRRLLLPIKALRRGTNAVSKGNLDYRLPVETSDELGTLAASFNKMAERLKKITATRDELETEIARRKHAEEKQNATLADLNKSHKEMQHFLYAASHDLQEPLRKIQAFGDRLITKEKDALSEKGRDDLQRVENAAARMQNLIADLLTLSRVSTQGDQFQPVDLNRIVADVEADFPQLLPGGAATLEVGGLPAISADETQIRQLFYNLIDNALKFRKPDVPPIIKIYARCPSATPMNGKATLAETDICEIVIEDNGIGIDPKHLDRIFGLFQKLDPRSTYRGSGVGLTLCKRIVERHGGLIRAESEPGKGTRLIFRVAHEDEGNQ